MIGRKFGKLLIISHSHTKQYTKSKVEYYECLCECGNKKVISLDKMKSGNTRSCGCLRREKTIKRFTKHGMVGTRLYSIYNDMRRRCYNKNRKDYKNYGGRGIRVCEEWLNDPNSFFKWAKSNGYEDGLTIERINPDGNYEPKNCKWVTKGEQNRNKRNSHNITIDGVTRCLAEWCEIYDVPHGRVLYRLNNGMDPLKALTEPPRGVTN